MLTEKYRPNKLDEIIGQNEIVRRLKRYVKNRNVPHLLFSGLSGTGKTTATIAMAKEIYGSEWQSNFLEINASDDRGIDVIRNKVKNYAATKAIGDSNDVQFKIVFLDESDALTPDAQGALRRTMEKYNLSCRFILSCNYLSKIIEPIISRCAVYQFKKIDTQSIMEKCKYIATQEKYTITLEALEAIAYSSDGDLRKAVGTLETSLLTVENNIITIDDIYKVSYIEPQIIQNIIKKALSGEFLASSLLIENLMSNGSSSNEILKQMMSKITDLTINDKMKIDIAVIIGDTSWRTNVTNEEIMLKWMIAKIAKLGSVIR
jgi:replication factor C small subunit